MMTTQEFENWCRSLHLSDQARAIIDRIRTSPPSRRIRSGARNVSGTYASHKMGETIQFASHTIAYAAILYMEHDPTVLEFYDQPEPIKLMYPRPNGRPATLMHTPDFFVLRKDSAGWEEWKDKQTLVDCSQDMSQRYQQQADGRWQCPTGQQYASQFGLDYHLHSSAELNPVFVRNLKFLEDYLRKNCPVVESSAAKTICERVSAELALTLRELLALDHGHGTSDDIYRLIVQGALYVDLEAAPLAHPEQVRVFVDASTAHAYALSIQHQTRGLVHLASTITPSVGERVTWDGTPWTIVNVGEEYISLLDEDKHFQDLPIATFDVMIKEGRLKGVPMDPPSDLAQEARARLKRASPQDCALAAQRCRIIEPLLQGKPPLPDDPTPRRTRRAWVRQFRLAQQRYGNGFLGLLPQRGKKGNRHRKIPPATLDLMRHVIDQHYETLKQQSKWHVYGRLVAECEQQAIHVPSFKTFCKEIAARPRHEQTVKREGRRAAYADAPRHHARTADTPRHGDRAFEIGHIDHTEADLELVDSVTGQNLGRPWATFLEDANSRRFLAVYLTFDPPSYSSVMMVLRICVMRFRRLPQIFVVDGGKEFQSVHFETLLAAYGCTKQTRPPAQPRFGSLVERLFGTANAQVIHNLQGNTQIMRNPRQATKSVDPKRLACWTLGAFYEHLCHWAYEVYDTTPHPALGQTPREHFVQSLATTGLREHRRIVYDETFRMLTLPSTRKGTAKVLPGEGVTINYLRYWADEFRAPGVENSSVEVRYDPFDCSVAYAYVRNQWVRCWPGHYPRLQGRSVQELRFIAQEERKKAQLVHQQYRTSSKARAEWFLKTEQEERVLEQQRRDAQHKQVLQIITGGSRLTPPLTQEPTERPLLQTSSQASPPQSTTDGNVQEDADLTYGEF